MRNIPDKFVVKDTFYAQYFVFENPAVYEVMWGNVLGKDRSQITIQYETERRDWHAG